MASSGRTGRWPGPHTRSGPPPLRLLPGEHLAQPVLGDGDLLLLAGLGRVIELIVALVLRRGTENRVDRPPVIAEADRTVAGRQGPDHTSPPERAPALTISVASLSARERTIRQARFPNRPPTGRSTRNLTMCHGMLAFHHTCSRTWDPGGTSGGGRCDGTYVN